MSKRLGLILTICASCLFYGQFSLATPIIELDNKNPIHCIQQLESAKDMFPIVLVYATHCPYAQLFLPTYKKVAESKHQQNRDFFQFDYDGSNSETAQKCLGYTEKTSLLSPTITVIIQLQDPDTGEFIRSMPAHAWGGAKSDPKDPGQAISISTEELEHIINIGPEEQFLKSQLTKRFSKQMG